MDSQPYNLPSHLEGHLYLHLDPLALCCQPLLLFSSPFWQCSASPPCPAHEQLQSWPPPSPLALPLSSASCRRLAALEAATPGRGIPILETEEALPPEVKHKIIIFYEDKVVPVLGSPPQFGQQEFHASRILELTGAVFLLAQ